MKSRTRLILAFTVMTLLTLACATLTGGGEQPAAQPPAALPTNTPLPPLPTSTPPPPADPEPTTSTPPIMNGEVLFFDDFSDPNSGWDRNTYDDGITDYEYGSYKIAAYIDTYYYWANPYQNFGDQIIDVQTSVLSTELDNQYGIVCRHQDVDNWYSLLISSDGYAAIRKRIQGNESEFLTDWVTTPAINQGNSTNSLHAECIGDRLALYVNGTLVIETYDTDIPTGDVGLIAGTFEATSVEVLFDNFQVSVPTTSGQPPAQPEPQAYPGAGPDFEALNTVFFDDFSNNDNNWNIYDDGDTKAELSQNGYSLSLFVEDKFAGGFPNLVTITDAALSVDATKLAGDDSQVSYGIMCHFQDGGNWHGLVISASGYASIIKTVDGSVSYLTDWVQIPDGFILGNQQHKIIASCTGDRLALYVNSIGVVEFTDPDIVPGGTYGLIVRTHEETNAQVLFDNFRIATP